MPESDWRWPEVSQQVGGPAEPYGEQHLRALAWFDGQCGTVGPRPWRRAGVSRVPGVTIAMTAERGIHVPGGWTIALSVAATRKSQYGDGKPLIASDGTWTYLYKAHSGSSGTWSDSQWNRGLVEYARLGVPFGVMRELASGKYEFMGLAVVDALFEEADTFLLRGPVHLADWVRDGDSHMPVGGPYPGQFSDPRWQDLVAMEDHPADALPPSRILRPVIDRQRQGDFRAMLVDAYGGTCAFSGFDADAALQAAHISGYSGLASHQSSNGMLLRADLHVLFDRHLIAVDTAPAVPTLRLCPLVRKTRYAPLDGMAVATPVEPQLRPASARLEQHKLIFDEVVARQS